MFERKRVFIVLNRIVNACRFRLNENRAEGRPINTISGNIGLKRVDAREFFDYAEWYLFNG